MGRSRRSFLAAGGAALGTGIAGCLGGDAAGVSILAAGSLQHALSTTFSDRVDADLSIESHGSAACARLVSEGLRDPDILVLSDPVLFDGLTQRYTAFATNALVVAYNPDTDAGRAVRKADRPYDPLLDRTVRLGRTDPDADPLGYRTLFSVGLAERRWDRPYSNALDRGQLFPETELLAAFETGALDAAVVYRNMAVAHDVPFRALPARLDLSAPRFADFYDSQSYELPSGRVVTGAPIDYGATARAERDSVASVFEALVAADWLGSGFEVPPSYPSVDAVDGRSGG